MAVINIHGGHNPAGTVACGAVGILDESKEDRLVAKAIIKQLRAKGHTVYNCTCNNGSSQTDVLKKIVAKCNAHTVALDVSVHFNSGAKDKKGNGKTTGTEVWLRGNTGIKKKAAINICSMMAKQGFTNRGIKETTNLYFLNHMKAPAILIEVCFVDDKDDAALYNKLGAEAIGKKIANEIHKVL